MNDKERADWLRLSRTQNVGPVTFAQLIARFGTAGADLDALLELAKRAGRKRPLVAPDRNVVLRELNETEAFGARVLCACELDFPNRLTALEPPPPVLTVLGRLDRTRPSVAIVTARNASAAGWSLSRRRSGPGP